MKKAFLFSLLMILTVMLILSCSNDKTNPDTESPTVEITYPPNNSSFTSGTAINIVAEADDNEEVDNVKFYIDGVNLYDDSSEPYTYNWDTTDLTESHTIYAKAYDTSENTTTSEVITVILVEENQPPNPPSNPNPTNNATSVSTNIQLSWYCTDPDGDPLTYDVYFGETSDPPLLNVGQNETNYNPGNLNEETTYYWKIKVHDDHSNSTIGDVWQFSTIGNQAPNPPTDPNPDDNATDVSIDTNLSWTCTDPEGDPLTYDVYFGTSSNPSVVSFGQTETNYDPGTLIEETTYFWKIKAKDDHSNSTIGDIWEFTTSSGGTGTVTDIDGNVYQTLVIGNQEWMAENLKVTHYRNGVPIPHVTDNSQWSDLSTGAYCYYNNDPANADTYGALYNWYAVDDSLNIAPEGWHIPSDEEIMELEMYLGMSASQANITGWRGTNEGSKLAGGYDLWQNGSLRNDPEFDTNGFSFLPGGYRGNYFGNFFYMGYTGYFWSSTEGSSFYAWYRALNCDYVSVYRISVFKQDGFSVRCVRD